MVGAHRHHFFEPLAHGFGRTLVERLNRELNAVLQHPDVRQRLENSGLQVTGGPPEDFAAILKRDYDKYGAALRAAGVTPE